MTGSLFDDRPGVTLEDVIARVGRAYRNEVAVRGGDEIAERLVSKWLAGVEFREWFALVEAHRRQTCSGT